MRSTNWAGVAAFAGGLGFAGFWVGSLLKVELVPWPVALAWHGLVIVLLTVGASGLHRSARGSQMQTWLGWLGIALVAIGQLFALEITMIGFVVFGAAVVMVPRLSPWGGGLLVLGAIGFLATTVVNGPFWGDPNPTPSLVPAVTFGVSLLVIAIGWVILGASGTGPTRLTSRRFPPVGVVPPH
jgi:hypothetical protein